MGKPLRTVLRLPTEQAIARTVQGRILTAKGFGAIGLKATTADQQSLL